MTFRLAVLGAILLAGAQSRAFGETARKISVKDDPARKEGSPTLVLVELSDFQCPFCGRAAREVIPKVEESLAMLDEGIDAIHIVGISPAHALLDEGARAGSAGTACDGPTEGAFANAHPALRIRVV